MPMDFGRYVERKVRNTTAKRHYIGPIDDAEDWNAVVKAFETGSPKELSQIIVGLARDILAGKVEIVFH